MSLDDVTWEEVGFMEIDAATAGFGDDTDVAELNGAWRLAGQIATTSGRCVAADPFCMHSGGYWQEFGAPNGEHLVEVYDIEPTSWVFALSFPSLSTDHSAVLSRRPVRA